MINSQAFIYLATITPPILLGIIIWKSDKFPEPGKFLITAFLLGVAIDLPLDFLIIITQDHEKIEVMKKIDNTDLNNLSKKPKLVKKIIVNEKADFEKTLNQSVDYFLSKALNDGFFTKNAS